MRVITLALFFVFSIPTYAAWYMVSGIEFQPYQNGSLGSYYKTPAQAYIQPSTNVSYLYAPLRLPIGARVTGLWCQLYDNSTTSKITISMERMGTYDSGGTSSAGMALLETSVSGAPGYQKVSDTSIGADIIDDWESTANGIIYYSYHLLFLPGGGCGSNCKVRQCAISYNP